MISACGLLCMAQYSRLTAIASRVHAFHHERLEVHRAIIGGERDDPDSLHLRFEGLEAQAHRMLGRARLVRNALVLLVTCVICMLGSTLAIGLSMLVEAFDRVAIGLFIAGTLFMLAAMVVSWVELRGSLRQLEYEHHRIASLDAPKSVSGSPG